VQNDVQDLTEYLARPRLISAGALPLSNRGTVYTNYFNYSDLLVYFPNLANRTQGVFGIRADLHFKLQVASTPFQQGVISLAFQHLGFGINAGALRTNRSERATNLPHVRMDISETTMVEFQVPYLAPHEFWTKSDTNYGNEVIGAVAINMLLPIYALAGLTAPTYKLFLSLVNVKLYAADNYADTVITPQSGKVVGAMLTEARESHLISGALGSGAKIARFIGRHIPAVSSYSSTASWFLDSAAGLAKYFGFSKHQIQDPFVRVNNLVTANEHNSDRPTAITVLTPMGDNYCPHTPEFIGTEVDEMSLEYLLTQYTQICIASLTTSNIQNDVIYACNVGPSTMWFRTPSTFPFGNFKSPVLVGAVSGFIPSGIMWWTSFFRQWRGGFTFRFTFGKTKFHAGRVLFNFNPGLEQSETVARTTVLGPEINAAGPQAFGYSAIFDLKDSNVFEFSVPYVNNLPYMTFGGILGGLSMTVLDPLLAPSTVTTSVPIMVEVKAMPGFEVSLFSGVNYFPNQNAVVLQSGKIVHTMADDVCQHTVGERLYSIKQLITIPHWNVSSTTSTVNLVLQNVPPPWWSYPLIPGTTPTSATLSVYDGSKTSGAMAQCFVFARGGTDYHVYTDTIEGVMLYAGYTGSKGLTYNGDAFKLTPSFATHSGNTTAFASRGDPLHVRVPFNSSAKRAYTQYGVDVNSVFSLTSNNATSNYYFRTAAPFFAARFTKAQVVGMACGMSAADDAALGLYIGPPICQLLDPTSITAKDPDMPLPFT
jgi:hypothetical protein